MAEQTTCVVCGGVVGERDSTDCMACGGRFHLNQRNDTEGKDCGSVWINEQYLALEFACQRCLDGAGGGSETKPAVRRPRVGRRRYRKRA